MLRVKIPQGMLDVDSARRAGRRRRALLARLRPHHDAAEHPVPFRQAARRRAGDAAAGRRRADHARGVRQLGAEHHRLPVRRRRRATKCFDVTPYAEALTRYLLRHPLSSTLPRKFKIAFEGCRGRSHRHRRSTTSAGARAQRADGRPPRLPRHRRRRHGDHVRAPARSLYEFLPASDILDVAEAMCACSIGSATTSTSSATG